MKKVLKVTGRIFLGILILIAAFLLIVFICHRVMLKKEDKLLESYPGELVEVNGHDMNVLVEGEGEHTLIFLSGAGDVAPVMSFEPLCSDLKGEYRTVVIEKFGYGMSDIVDNERDYRTMVDECREALKKSGVEGPYILCPYSKSGIDALIWAQSYPEEVEAVISLDMGFPESYDEIDTENMKDSSVLMGAVRNMGIVRLFTGDSSLPDELTKDEKAMLRALINRKYSNRVFFNEIKVIHDATDLIRSGDKPEMPMYLFLSNGEGTGLDTGEWRGAAHSYTDDIKNVTVTELDCGHGNLIRTEHDKICKEMRGFIETL